jgi:hypothetical protein
MRRYDGVAIYTTTNAIVLTKRNPKFSLKTKSREEATIDLARVNKKQALALGTLLIQAAR